MSAIVPRTLQVRSSFTNGTVRVEFELSHVPVLLRAQHRCYSARCRFSHSRAVTDGVVLEDWWELPSSTVVRPPEAEHSIHTTYHARASGRISASMLHGRIGADPGGRLPLYSYRLGGFIIDTVVAQRAIRCAYESDGATKKRDCPLMPGTSACVAGCTPTMLPNWTDLGETYWCSRVWTPAHHLETPAAVSASFFSCPWRPADLDSMLTSWAARRTAAFVECSPKCEQRRASLSGEALREYDARRARYYSEVVLDRNYFMQALPQACASRLCHAPHTQPRSRAHAKPPVRCLCIDPGDPSTLRGW